MSAIEQQFKQINDKLQQMLKQQASLSRENLQLKQELAAVRKNLEDQLKNKEELEQQVHILKLNAGGMGETDRKELEKKISGYLKEIDRCIALLGE